MLELNMSHTDQEKVRTEIIHKDSELLRTKYPLNPNLISQTPKDQHKRLRVSGDHRAGGLRGGAPLPVQRGRDRGYQEDEQTGDDREEPGRFA